MSLNICVFASGNGTALTKLFENNLKIINK